MGDRVFHRARARKYYLCVGIICDPRAKNRLHSAIHFRHLAIGRGVFALHQKMEGSAWTLFAIADVDSLRAPRHLDSGPARDENASLCHYS